MNFVPYFVLFYLKKWLRWSKVYIVELKDVANGQEELDEGILPNVNGCFRILVVIPRNFFPVIGESGAIVNDINYVCFCPRLR